MRRVIVTLLAIAILPSPAASQDCIDYGDYIHWVSGVDTPGSAYTVTVAGNYAYVATSSGLHVIDISDPAAPQIIGSVDTPGNALDVTVAGGYAYVADGDSGLQVIDVSDPSRPQIAGSVDTPGNADGVTVSRDFAYVTHYDSALEVIYVGNPANPALLTTRAVDMPGDTHGVAVFGDYVYVADGWSGLQVLDIRSPSMPQLVGGVDTPGRALGVTVSDYYAYVADGNSGLLVFDVSDPAAPQLVGGVDTPGNASRVTVSGDFAYVMGDGLHVFDISNPASPQLLGTHALGGRGDVVGRYGYLAAGASGLQVVDISNPANPEFLGGVQLFLPERIDVSSDYAYVTFPRYSGGWEPHFIGSSMQVIDISDPASPMKLGRVDTSGYARGVAVSGDYVYFADGGGGLQVVDISKAADPQLVGGVDTPGSASDVDVYGEYAYVADAGGGLQVVDISDRASPQIVGGVDMPGGAGGVDVSGDYAYVTSGRTGLYAVDIANPANPQIAGGVDTPGSASGVDVYGDYAYVADAGGGLQVVDVSDPANPQLVGSLTTLRYGQTSDVTVAGGYVYLVDGSHGLMVAPLQCANFDQQVTIDIKPGSDPNSINCKGNPGVVPVAVLTTDTFDAMTVDHTTVRFGPGEAAELHVRKGPKLHGNGAVSTRAGSGVPKRHEEDVDHDGDLDLVFHFARAETGIVCGDTEAVLTGQTYDGQSIFGSDTIQTVPGGGVEPEPDRMLQISPNPFNPATSIAFVVQEPQHVTVRVYDVRGQLVTELADGAYLSGRHQLEWRGRDASGRVVSSGMYFFRVDRGGQIEIRKALLLK